MTKQTINRATWRGVNGIITYLAENLVSFDADELPLVVEMSGRQLASFEQFRREFASDLHNGFEHLVVAVTSKEDLACVHLIKRTANRPHVDGIVVRNAQDDLWCSVESTDQVRCKVHVCCCCIGLVNSSTQIANLEYVSGLVHLVKLAFAVSMSLGVHTKILSGLRSA